MVFSSLLFTFYFLPIVLSLYYLAKEGYRNYILLVASFLFYAYGEPRFVLVMIASILINYTLALLIHRQKEGGVLRSARWVLGIAVVTDIGLLFVFKYLGFSVRLIERILKTDLPVVDIALPIGISFFTFQALSYVIDVYRGTVQVQRDPFALALYISFFPQLIAGPIVRYSSIEEQIMHRRCTLIKFGDGARRFLLGFSKKILLANNLAVVSEGIFGIGERIPMTDPLLLWIGSVSYSLQIFYDFSGYSDMAIGLGAMFGFTFEENFDHPYSAGSVTEFWRRWHISLGRWFRDYVYIPLGGSRVTVPRHLLNLAIVWVLTGIWHGANLTFVAWGLGYLFLLIIEKYLVRPWDKGDKLSCICWRVVTLLCVNFGWVIFNSPGVRSGVRYCLAMVGFYGTAPGVDPAVLRYLREYGVFMVAGILFSTPIMNVLSERIHRMGWIQVPAVLLSGLGCGMAFLWSVSYLILGFHNPFIYFNF